MPGCEHPEASFPSSHTMIVCVIMGSAIMLIKKYVKNSKMRFVLQIICILIITVTVVGRLISGVHWLTDIIGGILISAMLLAMYSGTISNS
ncbi:MAG: phosphatase PAP2 family protein [Bacillota bacterium]|jgi:membrane-associated phospholipid phosphatase|nr:phosphatase PAP2 family protein [Bacillota bacterium]NLV61781.1 phosphatase PAP2 family protein [Clostridiaceae bacterium]